MKRLVVIAVLSALTLAGCKTTESNYRESYEAAVRSRNAAEADLDSVVEPTIHNKIMEASRPYVQTVATAWLWVRCVRCLMQRRFARAYGRTGRRLT